jgi:small redox-active disulfide protein 2
MKLKVLGPGCARCRKLEEMARAAAAEAGVAVEVEHVTDTATITDYGVMSTPGLVVDEKLVMSGRLPRPEEIKGWLQAATA